MLVHLEREDEITGPVIAPFFPQVSLTNVKQREIMRFWLGNIEDLTWAGVRVGF